MCQDTDFVFIHLPKSHRMSPDLIYLFHFHQPLSSKAEKMEQQKLQGINTRKAVIIKKVEELKIY